MGVECSSRDPPEDTSLKILQIITQAEYRGAEVFAGQLADGLEQRGHEVWLAAIYRLPAGPVSLLKLRPDRQVEIGAKVRGRIEPSALWRLRRLLNDVRPDVVQANAFHSLKYAVLLKYLGRTDWQLVYRNVSVASDWVGRRWKRAWGRWLFRHVDRVTSVSDATAKDLSEIYNVPPSQVCTVRRGVSVPPLGVGKDVRRYLRELIQSNEEDPVILHLAGFTPEKNHRGLLCAFRSVQERFPSAHLVLCGDGPLRQTIQREASGDGSTRHIHFLGARDDAADLLAGSDLMVLASRIEGIPGVILEAGARGIPSVSTAVGAIPDVVTHGISGLLVPMDDMPGLANAMCRLLGDPEVSREMGHAARQYVLEHHDLNRCVEQFDELYDELCGQG